MTHWYVLTPSGDREGPYTTEAVAERIAAGAIAAETRLNEAGSPDWRPAWEWSAFRPLFPPQAAAAPRTATSSPIWPRAWSFAAGLVALPFVLLVVHLALFDGHGAAPLWLLLVVGIGAAMVVWTRASWSRLTARELAGRVWSRKPLRWAAFGAVAGAEVLALVLGVAGILNADDARRAAEAETTRIEAEQKAQAAEAARLERERALTEAEQARAALAQAKPDTPVVGLLNQIATLCKALAAVEELGVLEPKRHQPSVDVCMKSKPLAEQLAEKAPAAPVTPERPTLERPPYEGVVRIKGKIRGPFDGGGVVLEDNGELLLLEDGAMPRSPFVVFLHGYAEDTGRTVTLNVGRSGRVAKIYRVKDEETYEDDRAVHRAAVAAAQERYRADMVAYQRAVAALPADKRAHAEALAAHEAKLEKAEAVLRALVEGVGER